MKRIVKFFCMFLSSIMLLNASEKIVEADTKTEQITMTVGEKKKIKIGKNNKIKLSKKGIIQINKKGKIIAKKTGKVKVIITQNKKVKKYNIKVKAKELKIDFSQVAKMTVRDLVYGYYDELTLEEMEVVKNLLLTTTLRQSFVNSNKVVGNGSEKYKLCMYDIEDEELYNLNIGADGIQEHNGTAYFATEKMNMDIFADFLK